MDRRIEKTRKAIFDAFDALIVKFDYAKISVQNIINKAGVGRSTFYLHFTTKNDLLRAKCVDLFERIFVPIGTETTDAIAVIARHSAGSPHPDVSLTILIYVEDFVGRQFVIKRQ